MAELDIADFGAFYSAVHSPASTRAGSGGADDDRVSPFAWLGELVEQVDRDRRWPSLVDLPTGSGKTSLIDIALFLLALDAGRPREERWAPRRIVLVVDRRVIVDQAAVRGKLLRKRLTQPGDEPVLRAVAQRLRLLFGEETREDLPPLVATALRGGIARDASWALRPDLPAVIASTVDQVGSRLLFRGYGVSPSMRPVHAGLIGADTLLLLDEVHLSQPFAETVRRLGEYQSPPWSDGGSASRWHVVEMSATPGRSSDGSPDGSSDGPQHDRFPEQPLTAATADPALRPRLAASKPAGLCDVVKVPADAAKATASFAKACAREASDMLGISHVRSVAVVVNRVDSARAVAQALAGGSARVVLITGRMRPFDRDEVAKGLTGRLRTNRPRSHEDDPLIVVATQCIEAGADLDFDGLVTECASLSALRQRFGRLDRGGWLSQRGTPAPARILVTSRALADGDDAVYGPALAETWRWLQEQPSLDFGIDAFPRLDEGEAYRLVTRPSTAPALLPGHLDAWAQTQPRLPVEPDVAMWLHGVRRTAADVQVVWRADIDEDMLRAAAMSNGDRGAPTGDGEPTAGAQNGIGRVRELVASCPPGSGEALSLSRRAVLDWLHREPPAPLADVEGVEASDVELPQRPMRPALVWRGDASAVVAKPGGIAPGDLLVVPATYGGINPDDQCWDPSAGEPVVDLGHVVQWRQRRRAVVRLAPALWPNDDVPTPEDRPEGMRAAEHVRAWLKDVAQQVDAGARNDLGTEVGAIVMHLAPPEKSGNDIVVLAGRVDGPYVVTTRRRAPQEADGGPDAVSSVDSEEETSSFTATEVSLDEHLRGVECWAQRFVDNCALPDDVAEDLTLAARLHDLGKIDPRFQVMMHRGDEIEAAMADGPIAKSSLSASDWRGRRAARRRSGYPRGMRHEMLSLALIADGQVDGQAHDVDLVRHLVASHHGWCRPLPPAIVDDVPREVKWEFAGTVFEGTTAHGLERLDAGVPERFWRLVHRYGWHRLAWFEALLRLADHRRSEEEANGETGGNDDA